MSSEDQKQSEAVLIGIGVLSLWISHYPAIWYADLYGNYDLSLILGFWNKAIWINWPIAFALIAVTLQIFDRFGKPSNTRSQKNSRYWPIL